jgi:hypothetical protein
MIDKPVAFLNSTIPRPRLHRPSHFALTRSLDASLRDALRGVAAGAAQRGRARRFDVAAVTLPEPDGRRRRDSERLPDAPRGGRRLPQFRVPLV